MSTSGQGMAGPHVTQRDLEARSPASQALLTRFAVSGVILSGLLTGTAVRPPAELRLTIGSEAALTDNGIVIAESGWFGWDATYGTTSPAGSALASTDQESSDDSSRPREAEPLAELVRRLRNSSGLTWDQLARLFGVSRRALHLWASGGRMNAANHEQLARLLALIDALPGDTPEQRRAALLAPRRSGQSLFDELRGEHASTDHDVSGTPWTPGDLLGARQEPEEM